MNKISLVNHPIELDSSETAVQVQSGLPVQVSPLNESWFRDKPEQVQNKRKPTPSLFPTEEPNCLVEPLLQEIPETALDADNSGYRQRVSSSRVLEDQSHIKLESLANMLDRELNSTRKWDVSKLLEHMFSDQVLGLPVRNFTL